MTHLRQKMIEDLQLRGYAPGTQTLYVRAVSQLAEHYAKGPDQVRNGGTPLWWTVDSFQIA